MLFSPRRIASIRRPCQNHYDFYFALSPTSPTTNLLSMATLATACSLGNFKRHASMVLMNGEFRLGIKCKEAAGIAVSPARRFSGMTQNLPDGCLYNEFKNAKSACLSFGLSSRKRFLSCSASPP